MTEPPEYRWWRLTCELPGCWAPAERVERPFPHPRLTTEDVTCPSCGWSRRIEVVENPFCPCGEFDGSVDDLGACCTQCIVEEGKTKAAFRRPPKIGDPA